jgi:hypothetical protein
MAFTQGSPEALGKPVLELKGPRTIPMAVPHRVA